MYKGRSSRSFKGKKYRRQKRDRHEAKLFAEYNDLLLAKLEKTLSEIDPKMLQQIRHEEKRKLMKLHPSFSETDWSRGNFKRWLDVRVKQRIKRRLDFPSFEEWLKTRSHEDTLEESREAKAQKEQPPSEPPSEPPPKPQSKPPPKPKARKKVAEKSEANLPLPEKLIHCLKQHPDGLTLEELGGELNQSRQSLIHIVTSLRKEDILTKSGKIWQLNQ